MTQYDLIARVNHQADTWEEPMAKALRAVFDLHSPDAKGGCITCSWIINGFVLYELCPTIQAIEKELK